MSDPGPNSNGTTGLAKLLNQLNLPTLVLILLMQGGNLWETKSGNQFNAAELERAIREVHDLYPKLEEAIRRQQRMQETLDQLKNKP